MRLEDLGDYFRLRRYLLQPWGFLRLRHHPPREPFHEIPLKDGRTIRIHGNSMDRHIFHRIFARDEYRLNSMEPGSCGDMIDIGGHVGLFAVRAAPLARRLFSYEPVPSNYDLLLENVRGLPQVTAYPLGVAGQSGPRSMFASPQPAGHSLYASEADQGKPSLEVPCITVEEIFRRHGIERVSVLKLDCEGAEYEILYAIPPGLFRRIERICMEYHPVPRGGESCTAAHLARHLEESGHRVWVYPSKRAPGQGHIFTELSAMPKGPPDDCR